MKKILISLMILCFVPIFVNAETCDGVTVDEWCNASNSSCLRNLQADYNNWETQTEHSGTSCVKVIAEYKCSGGVYQSKTYFSGHNPNNNYICSGGNVPTGTNISLKASSAYERDIVGDSCTSDAYVPELWQITCSTNENTNNSNNGNGTSNTISPDNSNNNSSNNNSNNSGNDNIIKDDYQNGGTNSNGQITGTTDVKDTGVETYFIVLFSLVLLSYIILYLSKKSNLFKSI